MADRETIIRVLKEIANDKRMFNHDDYCALICDEAAELLNDRGTEKGNTVRLKPCPFRVHGERKASCTIPGEYYYNETFMPCLKRECPCYHEETGDAWCDRNGAYMRLNRRANDEH